MEIVNEHQKSVDEIKDLIQEQRELIASRDKEMMEKKNAEKELRKKIKDIDSNINRAQALIERARQENAQAGFTLSIFNSTSFWYQKIWIFILIHFVLKVIISF